MEKRPDELKAFVLRPRGAGTGVAAGVTVIRRSVTVGVAGTGRGGVTSKVMFMDRVSIRRTGFSERNKGKVAGAV